MAAKKKAKGNALDVFALNMDAVSNGRWFGYPNKEDLSGIKVKLACAGAANQHFAAVAQRIRAEHLTEIEADKLSIERDNELLGLMYAEAIVLDWKIDGLDFSSEAVIEVWNDPRHTAFRDKMKLWAMDEAEYREARIGDAVKN